MAIINEHRFWINYDMPTRGPSPLHNILMRANRQAIRVQSRWYAANTITVGFAWHRKNTLLQDYDGSVCDWSCRTDFDVEIAIHEHDGPANPGCKVGPPGGPFELHFIPNWLTDDDLAIIGAEIIDADEPILVANN